MNKPITLCDRCEKAAGCLLNFDGIPCRKNRTVEPTNYDRLISKTPEELAEWVWDAQTAGVYTIRGKHAWIEWLKSPADKEVEE